MSRFYNQFSLLIVSFWGLSLMILLTSFSGVLAQAYNPKTLILDNGLHIVVIENNRAPVVTQMLFYKVGSADEPNGKSGIAHFLEHLLFKGTEKLKPGEFSQIIARNGGKDNAFTSKNYTGYFQLIHKSKLELVMSLEADRMKNIKLIEKEFENEKTVVLEERYSRVDNNPSALLSEQINTALFMNHPYRKPIIGWEHEIKNSKNLLNCEFDGIIGSTAGIVGSIQVNEVIKEILNIDKEIARLEKQASEMNGRLSAVSWA